MLGVQRGLQMVRYIFGGPVQIKQRVNFQDVLSALFRQVGTLMQQWVQPTYVRGEESHPHSNTVITQTCLPRSDSVSYSLLLFLSSTHTSRRIGVVAHLNLPGHLGVQPKEQLRFDDNLHLLSEKIKMIFVTLA